MQQVQSAPLHSSRRKPSPTRKRNYFNVDDTDSEFEDSSQQSVTASNGWISEWKLYINTHEVVPDNMDPVRWWGVRMNVSY